MIFKHFNIIYHTSSFGFTHGFFFISLLVRPALFTVLLFETDMPLAYWLSLSFEILLFS